MAPYGPEVVGVVMGPCQFEEQGRMIGPFHVARDIADTPRPSDSLAELGHVDGPRFEADLEPGFDLLVHLNQPVSQLRIVFLRRVCLPKHLSGRP